MSGSPRSRTRISGGSAFSDAQAALPPVTQFTTKPDWRRATATPSAISASSSASRTRIVPGSSLFYILRFVSAIFPAISARRPASADSRPGRGGAARAFSNAANASSYSPSSNR